MTQDSISSRDLLLAAAIVFGRGKDVADIEFRIEAYNRLLDLAVEYGEEIEEFDVIRALEEIPGFRPRDEMRRIANELGILERHQRGLLRIKAELFLDDLFPGDQPSRLSRVPSDFVRRFSSQFSEEAPDVQSVLHQAFDALPKVLDAARESPVDLVTPFFRPLRVEDKAHLTFAGTAAATTAFLDLYLAAEETAQLLGPNAAAMLQAVRARAGIFVDAYISRIAKEDPFGDRNTLIVYDDDDYPGATRPTTVSNASLIGVLVQYNTADPKGTNRNIELIEQLTDFVLRCQNEDGGWPLYRYRSGTAGAEMPLSASIPLFSLTVCAGLLDASSVVNQKLCGEIGSAIERYQQWLLATAISPHPGEVAWTDQDGASSVDETAINLLSCLLVPLLMPSAREEMDGLIQRALRFLDRAWTVGPDAASNVHRITFRPPLDDGPALLPVTWANAGHARVLRAICLVSLRREMFPGFRTAVEMQKALSLICRDCQDGFWMHLANPEMVGVSTTVRNVEALVAYCAAAEKWRLAAVK